MERYNFKSVEKFWQDYWEKDKSFKVKVDHNKKKFYCLEMFPYPSGKIHMAVKKEHITPRIRVNAKPFTGPSPNNNRITPVNTVVTLESKIELNALS